jgi:hypothetical protein
MPSNPEPTEVNPPFDVAQWARGMANLAEAIAGVLRYEEATLREAVNRGFKNAGETFAAAFRQSEEGQR